MAGGVVYSLFQPCPDYEQFVLAGGHDCTDCYKNIHGRTCPTFRERLVRVLVPGMTPHQVQFLALWLHR